MNADMNKRVLLDTHAMAWLTTDEAAFKPLDASAEASTTRIVRVAPGSTLATPSENLGEEIIVLEGELADAHACYAVGAYLRNPPGSNQARNPPRSNPALTSATGCVAFVKRYVFERDDIAVVRIDTATAPWLPGLVPGLAVMPLHQHSHEHAALVRWQPETHFQSHAHFGGEEILVLEGVFEDEFGSYPAGCWLRSPHLSRHQPFSRPGCTIYVKTGHLPDAGQ
jgi:anti-sigma factor ChrR (cupin superfamily)